MSLFVVAKQSQQIDTNLSCTILQAAREPHWFEEYLGSVDEPENKFDLRSFLGHLVDAGQRQRGHVLKQIVDVRTR